MMMNITCEHHVCADNQSTVCQTDRPIVSDSCRCSNKCNRSEKTNSIKTLGGWGFIPDHTGSSPRLPSWCEGGLLQPSLNPTPGSRLWGLELWPSQLSAPDLLLNHGPSEPVHH